MYRALYKLFLARLLLVLALCSVAASLVYADISGPRLKAVLTYKLFNYVTWVNDANVKRLDIAYWGTEDAYYTELKNASSGTVIRGKNLTVTQVDATSFNPKSFEVLIVASNVCSEALPVINQIRRNNLLVITDACPYKRDFMINFVNRDNKISFEINRTNVVFEGLRVDKDIYLLGGTELDVAELFRDSEYQLQKIKNDLDKKIKELSTLEAELKTQNETLGRQFTEIDAKQKAINQQNAEITQKREENKLLTDRISTNNDILEFQLLELKNKNKLISQQNTVLLIGAFVLLVFLAMLIYISIISKQRNRVITELKQIKIDLEISREEEKHANEQKSVFLAKMSHEIRTPMSGVLGMSELLDYTPLTEEQKTLNRSIRAAGKVLLSVINDILDFSKLEAGRVVLESVPFNLRDMLEDVANIFYAKLHEKELSFIVDAGPELPKTVIGDPLRLEQILFNLIGNAFKFTEKGRVQVVVSKLRVEDSTIRFSISDTGIGISDENKKNLFNAFVQADNTITREFGGSGLGLVICKQLVEQMGGSIGYESRLGQGSTFWIDVSLPETHVALVPKQLSASVDVRDDTKDMALYFAYRLRVLVAEDNELLQTVMKGILERFGSEPEFVHDGEKVLQTVTENYGDYDLVLMDCEMPLMDGIEATRRIREWERQAGVDGGIKIIALSAHVLPEYLERSQLAGVDDFLVKPVDTALLQATLLRTIRESLARADSLDKIATRRYYGDKEELFNDALLIFQSHAVPELQIIMALLESLSRENLQQITMLAHKHKASAYMIGANKLGHILQAINKHAAANCEAGLVLFKPHLKQSLQETLKIIHSQA